MDIYSILASKPHNPHYLNRYITFIQNCQQKNVLYEGYAEKHHICPKAKDMFPEYKNFKENPWNCVRLTPRQHLIAHMILYRAYKSLQSPLYALNRMINSNNTKINTKLYEKFKYNFSERMKGKNNPFYGKKHTAETKEKISKIDRRNSGRKISESRKTITENGFTLQEQITLKRMRTMTEVNIDGSTIYQKLGKKSGFTRKKRGTVSGSKNPKARKIIIYNSEGIEVIRTHGNFEITCVNNGYPTKQFIKSLNLGWKVFGKTRKSDISQYIKNYGAECYEKYKGWYLIFGDLEN